MVRFVRYEVNGSPQWAKVKDVIHETGDDFLVHASHIDISHKRFGYEFLGKRLEDAREKHSVTVDRRNILPVIPDFQGPSWAVGLNYFSHAQATGQLEKPVRPDPPVWFIKGEPSAHLSPIVLPPAWSGQGLTEGTYSGQVDFEVELVIVVGQTIMNVDPENALSFVAGYSVGNDVSDRFLQGVDVFQDKKKAERFRPNAQWGPGKTLYTFSPHGPFIATDVDSSSLDIRLMVNGEVRQQGNTSEMMYTAAELLANISRHRRIPAGTTIYCGTPKGTAVEATFGDNPQPARYLKIGDRVEATIRDIGSLVNVVTAPPQLVFPR
ncbi:fumarylacetoacetate hydrolase family protein [Candidatus Woesearchaeota archaeon]|nr:fumarylacetoacetate hydrolase family protein [Candidatus Woesearchaeota archaeon]